jgi:mannose-1-phosphate guanylyltransferase
MLNIILCGGSGTRLWPKSRKLYPKQFLKLFDNNSLFELTVKRNQNLCDEILVISNQDQSFLAQDQMPNKAKAKYLLEPIGRNTAPAIALAAHLLDPETIMLVTPSDHLIKNQATYNECLKRAKELAGQDYLVTFGIKPTRAETGYGYINAKGEEVISFKEKPDQITAQAYVDSQEYYWNSGIFCFKAKVFLAELAKYRDDIYQASQCLDKNSLSQNTSIKVALDQMQNIPAESIDYAVMEKSDRVKMVMADFEWSDMGGFEALSSEVNNYENAHLINCHNTTVIGEDRFIGGIGLKDIVIVDTADALIVSTKEESNKVKELLQVASEKNPELANVHMTAYRPWGSYTVLADKENFKVKYITVKPGHKLSLQKHKHRSEHWVVVQGCATVTNQDQVLELRPNEFTYIPAGAVHRLENKTEQEVIIVETQIGSYLGEDDIERLQDDYKRC